MIQPYQLHEILGLLSSRGMQEPFQLQHWLQFSVTWYITSHLMSLIPSIRRHAIALVADTRAARVGASILCVVSVSSITPISTMPTVATTSIPSPSLTAIPPQPQPNLPSQRLQLPQRRPVMLKDMPPAILDHPWPAERPSSPAHLSKPPLPTGGRLGGIAAHDLPHVVSPAYVVDVDFARFSPQPRSLGSS